jgi:hypothetical protein
MSSRSSAFGPLVHFRVPEHPDERELIPTARDLTL